MCVASPRFRAGNKKKISCGLQHLTIPVLHDVNRITGIGEAIGVGEYGELRRLPGSNKGKPAFGFAPSLWFRAFFIGRCTSVVIKIMSSKD